MGVFYVSGQKDRIKVGRDRSCDLVIDDHFISRCHLVLTAVTHDVAAFEVTGTNGAVCRGQKVNKGFSGYLRFGDSIDICGNEIVWIGSASPFDNMFILPVTNRQEVDITPIEIEGPPQRSVPEKPSIMLAAGPALTMALPILLGAGRVIAILSSVFAAGWAVANVIARAGKKRAEETRRKNAYLAYLGERKNEISKRQKEAKEALDSIYPAVGGYFKRAGDSSLIWSRNVSDGLMVRSGRGWIDCPFAIDIPKDGFAIVDDSLKEFPSRIRSKYSVLREAPVLTDISGEHMVAFAAGSAGEREIVFSFILQLAVNYSPGELKITIDIKENLCRYFGWIAYLPHYTKSPEATGGCGCVLAVTDDSDSACSLASNGCRVLLMTEGGSAPAGAAGIRDLTKKNRIMYDRISEELAFSYASSLSCLWQKKAISLAIPENVSFGDILDGPLSADLVAKEYAKCDITTGIFAPLGIEEGGRVITLDLHEKGSGPHGIIAGTTGSGKSELLTTLILSLAVKYPPDKLSFFLIDYKGGGMSNLFKDLPHLSGSISNLSGAESKRAMIALESENIRRQKMLAKAGVNNINDYIANYDRGLTDTPLPHVLIVIDEFAQLRRDEPEFMDSLISLSQVGRSLGMHLILATQKPSGVVDDRIRSNSGFRIALRLVDKADSVDIIGSGDAALTDRCGRAYLQTFLAGKTVSFQCAYAMGRSDRQDDKIRIFEDSFCQKEIKMTGENSSDDGIATWFELAMLSVKGAVERRNCRRPMPLFLPPLPEMISDDRFFAVFDDPYRQCYDPAVYDPEDLGNVLIAGKGGRGKSSLLDVLIQRLNGHAYVYITDNGGGLLGVYKDAPFCGGYVDEDDADNAMRMALYIDDVITSRRRKRERGPLIAYVLDGYDTIFGDPELYGIICRILSNAQSAGVVVLAASASLPGSKEQRLFDTIFIMGREDAFAVSSVFGVSARAVPDIADVPGRGIGQRSGRVLEFQAAKSCHPPGKPPPGMISAPRYPYVPASPSVEDLLGAVKAGDLPEKGIPVGFEDVSGRVFFIPTGRVKCVLIAGRAFSGRHEMLFNISLIAARYHLDTVSADTYEALISSCRDPDRRKMIFIDDVGTVLDDFYSRPREQKDEDELASIFDDHSGKKYGFEHPVVFGVIENDARVRFAGRKIYESMTKHPFVLWLGGGLGENRNFDISDLSFGQIQKSQKQGYATILKFDENTYSGPLIVPSKIIVDNSQTQ